MTTSSATGEDSHRQVVQILAMMGRTSCWGTLLRAHHPCKVLGAPISPSQISHDRMRRPMVQLFGVLMCQGLWALAWALGIQTFQTPCCYPKAFRKNQISSRISLLCKYDIDRTRFKPRFQLGGNAFLIFKHACFRVHGPKPISFRTDQLPFEATYMWSPSLSMYIHTRIYIYIERERETVYAVYV